MGRLKLDVKGLACHTQELGCGPRKGDGPRGGHCPHGSQTDRMTGEASGLTEPAFRRRPLSEGGPGKNSSAPVMNVSSRFTPCWPISSF